MHDFDAEHLSKLAPKRVPEATKNVGKNMEETNMEKMWKKGMRDMRFGARILGQGGGNRARPSLRGIQREP